MRGDAEQDFDLSFPLLHEHRHKQTPYKPGPFARTYVALLVAGVAGAVGVYLVLLALVPGSGGNRLDVAKTALLVIGGSGALAGLYVAYRKQRTDEANHVRDQDKLFTERYTQAAAQLGSDKAAVRLAGIYALARIADDSERDRPTCIQVLCAYLRMPFDPGGVDDPERQVRLTAQAAINDRLNPRHPGFWEMAIIDLRGGCLIDLDFRGAVLGVLRANEARFIGNSSFTAMNCIGAAHLTLARFTGHADFRDVDLWGDTDFCSVEFEEQADFSMGVFRASTRFSGAAFHQAVEFTDAGFTAMAEFDHAEFKRGAMLNGVEFEVGATFEEACFAGSADFTGAELGPDPRFKGARFDPDQRPTWPTGFAEPDDILWLPGAAAQSKRSRRAGA